MLVSEQEILGRILDFLNENQKQAVTAPSNGRLQIIAGPGTGKTKVLVSRVAHLLIVDKIRPDNMIVTTFTKKAANEMTDRLHKLLAGTTISIDKLIIGTFHSICYRIIKRYGKSSGLENYTIADEREKAQLLAKMFEGLQPSDLDILERIPSSSTSVFKSSKASNKYRGYDGSLILKKISSLKSKAIMPETYATQAGHNKALAFFYDKYQLVLLENQKLDFDDCLLKCYILVKKYPVLNYIKHVLVDEFQDTNEIQLQLMYHFAQGHISNPEYQHNVTIVGDPDQSIYAFRDAQSVNFKKMETHYKKMELPVTHITLNENYRSTSDILSFSELVMRQQKDRHEKSLKSQTDASFKPVYQKLNSAVLEAQWIVYQIEFLLALPNSPIKCEDIAILVRAGYQTKVLEDELVKHGISYKILRGKAFWDRKEVVAMIDYLRVCGDENDALAVLRTLNYPKRGLGPKTLEKIAEVIDFRRKEGWTVHDCLRTLAYNREPRLTLSAKVRQSVKQYVEMIHRVDLLLQEIDRSSGERLKGFLSLLFDDVYEKSMLKKEFKNANDEKLNIEEVAKQFVEFTPRDESLPSYIGAEEGDIVQDNRNIIIQFIDSLGLYDSDDIVEHKAGNDDDDDENSASGDKKGISLSTIHGSKGLEWPVVFVPGLSEGILPAGFALRSGNSGTDSMEPVHEERRCFYVATTRAKTLLYISSYTEVSDNPYHRSIIEESRFISDITPKMELRQTAFDSMANFEKLYKLLEKEELLDRSFPLDEFYKSYKRGFQSYTRGAPISFVKNLQPKGLSDNLNHISAFGGFQSSRILESQTTNKEKKKVAKKNNKAPPYIPSRPSKKAKTSSSSNIKQQSATTVSTPSFMEPLVTGSNPQVQVDTPDIVEISALDFEIFNDPHKNFDAMQTNAAPSIKTNMGYIELSDNDD